MLWRIIIPESSRDSRIKEIEKNNNKAILKGCSMENSLVPAQTGRRKNTTENKNTKTALADKFL
jgi:hypothetical protein